MSLRSAICCAILIISFLYGSYRRRIDHKPAKDSVSKLNLGTSPQLEFS